MAKIVAIANQKGGVGKTTTAINLGAALGAFERRTLLVDCDPQGNATRGLGLVASPPHLYQVLVGDAPIRDAIRESGFPNLDVLPSDRDLVGVEVEFVGTEGWQLRLRGILEEVAGDYDMILLDCPPSLGHLTVNALSAADGVLVPLQTEYFALEGISELMATVRRVQATINPGLDIAGILLTMYDDRTNLSKDVAAEIRNHFPGRVFDAVVPRNVRLAEAPSHGLADLRVRHQVPGRGGVPRPRPGVHARGRGVSPARKRGLGRGLDALLQDEPARTLPVDQLHPNKYQPRTAFDEEKLDELAQSIRAQGLMQPIVVTPDGRGTYSIIAGERRWRASQRAGLEQVPVVVREVADDRELLELALVENLQRSDLNPVEEAEAYRTLASKFDLSQEEIATRVGKARSTVANALRLLKLPDEIQQLIRAGQLTAGQARPLLAIEDVDRQLALATEAVDGSLTARDLEQRAAGAASRARARPRPRRRRAPPGRSPRSSPPPPRRSSPGGSRPRWRSSGAAREGRSASSSTPRTSSSGSTTGSWTELL